MAKKKTAKLKRRPKKTKKQIQKCYENLRQMAETAEHKYHCHNTYKLHAAQRENHFLHHILLNLAIAKTDEAREELLDAYLRMDCIDYKSPVAIQMRDIQKAEEKELKDREV